jgi:hypothetical protein
LITDVQMTPQSDGTLVIGFQEKVGEPPHRGFQARVKADLIVGLLHLMRDAMTKADWQTAEQTPTTPEVPPPPARGYLN